MPPKRPWGQQGETEGVRYELVTTLSKDGAERLKELSPFVDVAATDTRLWVAQTAEGLRRVEAREGMFGDGVVYLRDVDGSVVYLNDKVRHFLHLPSEALPGGFMPKVKGRIEKQGRLEQKGEPLHEVDVMLDGPTPGRLRLWLTSAEQYGPYRRAALDMVLGCTKALAHSGFPAAELAQIGFPLRGEFQPNGSTSVMSRFELQDLGVGRLGPETFAIPDGYTDIRCVERTDAKKPYRPHPKRRLRHGRPGRPARPSPQNPPAAMAALSSGLIASPNAMRLPEGDCSCLPSTYGSQIASTIYQPLADDLKQLVNLVSRRLGSFSGNQGKLEIDWLDSFKAYSDNRSGGDGLFCLLRDAPVPGDADPDEAAGGAGLLDRLAEVRVRDLLVQLEAAQVIPIPSQGFSLGGQVVVPQGLGAAVLTVLANEQTSPEARYEQLGGEHQVQLRELYLAQRIASLSVDYPASTPSQSVFHDLLRVKLDNVRFDVDFDQQPLIDTLRFGNNQVRLVAKLPGAHGEAFLSRWPSTLYFAVLTVGSFACPLVPGLCALLPAAAAVGIFLLLDFAFVNLSLDDLEVDVTVSMVPDADNILRPSVELAIDGDVTVGYDSKIPDGVHQILGAIYSLVLSHTDLLVSVLEGQLAQSLTRLLSKTLGLQFPPRFETVPVTSMASVASGVAADHLYLGAQLNTQQLGLLTPYVTQVATNVRPELEASRQLFAQELQVSASVRHYAGLALSQNFINHYIHVLWRRGDYHHVYSGAELREMSKELASACPGLGIGEQRALVGLALCHAVSPRLVLNECGAERGHSYMTCFFDDLRLCASLVDSKTKAECRVEFRFAAKVSAQLGFGSVDRATGRLDILRVTGRLFDIYFDRALPDVQVIHAETHGMASGGKCDVEPSCECVEQMGPALHTALRLALRQNDARVIPRDEDEPLTRQRYSFAGQFVPVGMSVKRGNLYVHFGFAGTLLLLMSGGLGDINELSCADGKALLTLMHLFG